MSESESLVGFKLCKDLGNVTVKVGRVMKWNVKLVEVMGGDWCEYDQVAMGRV